MQVLTGRSMPDDGQTRDLHFLSIAEAARLIERRRLSSVELTEASLCKGEAIDPPLLDGTKFAHKILLYQPS